MDEYLFSVNLGGMISILSDHLYSSPKVFLRELLQNAVDAINMRKSLEPGFDSGEINIIVNENNSITFCDNGSGLTEEEIHKFVSVIGQSSKRSDSSSFIGRFGIGLLSCFIVTDEIVMRSRSVKNPGKVIEWHGFSDGKYSVSEIAGDMETGTEIFIKSAKGSEELFTAESVAVNIRYYGLPIPFPVYVSSECGDVKVRVNALFSKTGPDAHKSVLEMGRSIFGTDYDFIDYIPLESKNGLFSGAAYILPFTVSAAANNQHRIYLKNMLLTEDGSSILPEWAFFVKCFLNTDKLRPTASREDFYEDDTLNRAKAEIAQCISSYLEKLSVRSPAILAKIVSLHGTALKSVAGENEQLFRIFMPFFRFETSFGILSGRELTSYRRTIFYTSDMDSFRQLRPIFAEMDELLLNTCYAHEKSLVKMLEKLNKSQTEAVSENLLDSMLEDCTNHENFCFILSVFSEALAEYDCRVQLKSYNPAQLSSVYSINADGEIKRDIQQSKENSDSMFTDMLEAFEEEIEEEASAVLYINSRNDLIIKLSELNDREKLTVYAQILYVQALISGGFPVRSREMNIMNNNLIKLIEWGI